MATRHHRRQQYLEGQRFLLGFLWLPCAPYVRVLMHRLLAERRVSQGLGPQNKKWEKTFLALASTRQTIRRMHVITSLLAWIAPPMAAIAKCLFFVRSLAVPPRNKSHARAEGRRGSLSEKNKRRKRERYSYRRNNIRTICLYCCRCYSVDNDSVHACLPRLSTSTCGTHVTDQRCEFTNLAFSTERRLAITI